MRDADAVTAVLPEAVEVRGPVRGVGVAAPRLWLRGAPSRAHERAFVRLSYALESLATEFLENVGKINRFLPALRLGGALRRRNEKGRSERARWHPNREIMQRQLHCSSS